MKAFLITCMFAVTTLCTFAQTNVPVKKEVDPKLAAILAKIPEPKLVVSREAIGNVEVGRSKSEKNAKRVPQGTTLVLANGGQDLPKKGDVHVFILSYSYQEAEMNNTYNEVVIKQLQKVKLETIITDMKAAGYRPATAEQVEAVRGKLSGKTKAEDVTIRVFGTVLQKDDKTYTMGIAYGYVMGTDLLGYGEGLSKIGFYDQKDWYKHQIYLAAVKIDEGLNEKPADALAKKDTEKPAENKKKK